MVSVSRIRSESHPYSNASIRRFDHHPCYTSSGFFINKNANNMPSGICGSIFLVPSCSVSICISFSNAGGGHVNGGLRPCFFISFVFCVWSIFQLLESIL